MTAEPSWDDLISRLEDDLRARESADPVSIVDDEAWEIAAQLLRSRGRILAFSHSGLQPSDIEDLVQSVLLKIQSAVTLRRLRAARSTEGYVFVILRNAANDLVRRRQFERNLFSSLDEGADEPASEPRYVEQTEAASVIGEVLQSLGEGDRELLQMRFWRNMTIAEIANETGISYSTTAVRLFRILHRLRDQLNA
jgi:RNA polymerase sigma factor (sigma-70 family)